MTMLINERSRMLFFKYRQGVWEKGDGALVVGKRKREKKRYLLCILGSPTEIPDTVYGS